jgi:hypothetical protein
MIGMDMTINAMILLFRSIAGVMSTALTGSAKPHFGQNALETGW